MRYRYDPDVATTQLRHSDPPLGATIDAIGEFGLVLEEFRHPFEALTRAVVFQQLSGRSAAAIYTRVLALGKRNPHPTPRQILRRSDEACQQAGLSRAKTRYLKDLASHTLCGTVPNLEVLDAMNDDEIIERLTKVKGIGVWSAQMLLISYLGRGDVLPASDLGIRKGFQYVYRLGELPSEKAVAKHGERWRPYRSVASWYLWQASYL